MVLMKKYIFPALFEQDKQTGKYTVVFPDLSGCVTEGENLEDAFIMAQDALGIYLFSLEEDNEQIPEASDPLSLERPENAFSTLVDVDMTEYRRKYDNKSVKKTLTIPNWLNAMAEKENINFSQELQAALKVKLGIE